MIKHLWSKIFIAEGHNIVTDYIRFVRTHKSDGDIHADKFIKDLMELERICGLQTLPDKPHIADIDKRLTD